ncbi:MAG TPA: mechanosensitive ion channel family protein [Casimicrobiaceae bacterium]|nr:mechanosensitive ion channel family protein [Casimicrobiaceae bacterium]
MVQTITLQEALGISAVALLCGLLTMRFRPELRRSVLVTLLIIVLGLGGLAALSRFQLIPAHLAIAVIPREICLLIVAIGNIRIFITFMTSVLLARRAVPRILGEVTMALSLVVYAVIRLDAVGVNPTSLIATTTVAGAAIAFAMQSTLGNLLGGISLQLDNTCRIGDWIELDGGVTGEVVGIRWRYTALATVNNVTIIIPNAELMKNRVTLLGRRGDQRIPWRRPIEFGVGYEWTPGRVLEVVGAALERAELPFVATEPMAHCICTGFDSTAIKYVVYYWLTDIKSYLVTDSRVRVHVYAALGRAGMEIPISRSDLYLHSGRHLQLIKSEREQESRVALLRSLELFAPLTDDETHALAAQLIGTPFGVGDFATRQGEPSDSLYILARGSVGIFRDAAPGSSSARQRLATLAAPEIFGEMGLLTGEARSATIAAESEVLCYRLDKAAFESIIQARPELAAALAQTATARSALNDATLASLSAEARARATVTRVSEVLRRIRQFFGLEDAD